MDTNITQTILSRLEITGMSQALFAEIISATPAQTGIFLKEKGSLSTEQLNKGLTAIGINLNIYTSRIILAREIALFLLENDVASIDKWTKERLASFCEKPEILLFFDVENKAHFKRMLESDLIDIESTFPYFKALVSYFMMIKGKNPTASEAKKALTALMDEDGNSTENVENNGLLAGAFIATATAAAASIFSQFTAADIVIGATAAIIQKRKQIGAATLFSKREEYNSLFSKGMEYLE